jgi:hypothetical protein
MMQFITFNSTSAAARMHLESTGRVEYAALLQLEALSHSLGHKNTESMADHPGDFSQFDPRVRSSAAN